MKDIDRIIGELQEFKRATLVELKEIRKEVRSQNQFKWKVAGGFAVLSIFMTGSVEAILRFLNRP